jgi:Zn-dependent metalloprotease
MRALTSIVLSSFFILLPFAALADQKISSLNTYGDKATVSVVVDSKSSHASFASAPDPVFAAQAFIEQNASALKVSAPGDTLLIKSATTDSLQTSHIRYRQELNGIPVWGAELTVHIGRTGNVTSVTGTVSELGAINTTPRLSQGDAEDRARGSWISEFGEDDGEVKSGNLYIVDEILIDKNAGTKLHLAWEVQLTSSKNLRSFRYLVDADTGDVIAKFSLIKTLNRVVFDCSPGGSQGLNDGFCRLDFFHPGPPAHVFGRSEGQPDRGANPLYSSDQFDTDFIYYRAGVAHQYFQTMFGRNGANFAGGIGRTGATQAYTPLASYAGDGTNHDQYGISFCPNANWDPDRERLSFCKGLPTMDIVGHEYTHAIEYYSLLDEFNFPRGFNGSNEPGALSEGFSDVFGEAAERFAYNSNNWTMGSSQNVNTPIMRSLSNPESTNNPSTMYSPSYFCGSDDRGGIHINNVVLGHAAYRLANGGDLSGCIIQGIGPQKQETIFYRALTTYLSPSSGYAAAYTGLINACVDIFGTDSPECLQTRRTVNAVMMNQPGRCSGVPAQPVDCLDPTDLCPTNPNKRAPGICGCVDEVDADANGALDCVISSEFKADLAALSKQINRLIVNPPKNKKAKQKAIRADINRIVAELKSAVTIVPDQIVLTSASVNLGKLFSAVRSQTKTALKASAGSLSSSKSNAKKSISKLIKKIV